MTRATKMRTTLFDLKMKAIRRGDSKQHNLINRIMSDDDLVERLDLIMTKVNQDKPQ